MKGDGCNDFKYGAKYVAAAATGKILFTFDYGHRRKSSKYNGITNSILQLSMVTDHFIYSRGRIVHLYEITFKLFSFFFKMKARYV